MINIYYSFIHTLNCVSGGLLSNYMIPDLPLSFCNISTSSLAIFTNSLDLSLIFFKATCIPSLVIALYTIPDPPFPTSSFSSHRSEISINLGP